MRLAALCLLLLSVSTGVAQTKVPAPPDPVPMPSDRVADSYAIYQQVLPSPAIEWSEVKRTQWLLEAVTTPEPCESSQAGGIRMGLRGAVQPPPERQAEWDEVLADFAAHCSERYRLNGAEFQLAVPVHMMDEAAIKRYWQGVAGFMPPKNNIMQAPATPDEFKGAAGLHSFSAVYFNRNHTLAATYFGMGCGGLCGMWRWVVLEKKDGVWKPLGWVHSFVVS